MRTKQGINDLIKGIMIEGSVNVTNLDKIADRIIEALTEENNLFIPDVSVSVAEVRQAFGDYVSTEGCSCCQDVEGHEKASNRPGELLNADQYDDDSGYDWYKYATER